jgi:hypothetical protein
MKTEDLIKGLAADRTRGMAQDSAWLIALLAGSMMAAITFFALLGLRPDFANAMETIRFIFKFVITIVLSATAWAALRALSTPAAPARSAVLMLLVAPAMLGAAAVAEIMILPEGERMARMIGTNNLLCLLAIPAIGAVPLAIFIAALRYGAPSDPGRAGMVAGILAGAVAATFYAAHCTDDSPLFVIVWYTLAIAILAGVGALAGRCAVRW